MNVEIEFLEWVHPQLGVVKAEIEGGKPLVLKAKIKQEQREFKEWVGLMRGIRVEGNSVIITVNGGNDEARFLCKELINEMAIHKEKT